ncbi:hypothetical protein ACFQ3P_39970 [Paraburkholderia sabiae]|uniref:DUF5666 domain-containing protein n=1 Tax=Paraburkholderia sabiae TaxID=273251 RepID=A0ABU9QR43_9BURK|nr:hypothetical protein [Paraburkholderia sabiae]WJZ79647.1 hypothetical protein QEN71_40970 [Paraburkholderia sabiae]CAD6562874.1 hypothetical protein LMG24235_08116 [Paraburkholderia sabiae]
MSKRTNIAFATLAAATYVLAVVAASTFGSTRAESDASLSWGTSAADVYSGRYVTGNETCAFRNEVIADGAISIDRHCTHAGDGRE